MDYAKMISEMRGQHCGACAAGLAMRALEELARQQGEDPVIRTFTYGGKTEKVEPKPKKQVKTQSKPAASEKGRTEKACNKCHTIKPLAEFPFHKDCADGHTGTCRVCTADRQRRRAKAIDPLARIEADTKSLHDFRCVICHANFQDQDKLDAHNKLRH